MWAALRRPWVAGIMAGLLALAAGYAIGVFTTVPAHPGEGSADVGFARDMSIHHAQAVEMSLIEYRRTAHERLAFMSRDIATMQQGQIGAMTTWLKDWGMDPTSTKPPMEWMKGGHHGGATLLPDGRMPGMASEAELERLKTLSGRELDVLFSQLMIDHHLGGIHMADAALDRASDPDVRAFAQSMKDGQQNEISALTEILAGLGAKPRSAG